MRVLFYFPVIVSFNFLFYNKVCKIIHINAIYVHHVICYVLYARWGP